MKTAKIIPTSTLMVAALGLALGLAAAPALANPADSKGCHDHKDCGSGDDSSEGGKAFLFQIFNIDTCEPTIDTGISFGNVSWKGNILFDPKNIHVHFTLQLTDVDPSTGLGYAVLGNNDETNTPLTKHCDTDTIPPTTPDFPLCAAGGCDPLFITVKQNRRGSTKGDLRVPGCDTGETTTVWVTVDVMVLGDPVLLRSTPVEVVLPLNEVGSGCG